MENEDEVTYIWPVLLSRSVWAGYTNERLEYGIMVHLVVSRSFYFKNSEHLLDFLDEEISKHQHGFVKGK